MLPAASRPAAPPAQPAIQAPVVPTWPAPAPAPPHARLPPESGVVPTEGGVPVASAVPPRPNCRKRAVDADDTDDDAPPPASRPIKQEKRKNAHGYDCTDGFCVDGDEDEPARGARTSTEDIFGEPDSDAIEVPVAGSNVWKRAFASGTVVYYDNNAKRGNITWGTAAP